MLTVVDYGRRFGQLERVTAPVEEPLSVEEAKLFLRVDGEEEDEVVTRLIAAARQAAESFMRRSMVTQGWALRFDDYAPSCVWLPMGPVQEVGEVTLTDRDGQETVVSEEGYTLSAGRDKLFFDASPFSQQVEIAYTAGFGDAEDVPAPLKQGMLHHVARMYEDRIQGAVPEHAMALYMPFRQASL